MNKSKNIRNLFIFIGVCLFFIYSFSLILYGANLQKNQTAANVQTIIYNLAYTKLKVIPNFFLGLKSNPDHMIIDIDQKGIALLNQAREQALKRGFINKSDQNYKVKGTMSVGEKNYNVEISPTGFNLDMIGDYNKRAYKVKVKGGKKIFGVKEFKLLPPKSRGFLVEWVAHALEQKESLISIRYFFINLNINGENKGIYAFEEHFGKELLENNNVKDGIIFKIGSENDRFAGNEIQPFNSKKLLANQLNVDRLEKLRTTWVATQNGDFPLNKFFDYTKMARFFAIVDLTYGYHATTYNSNFYYHPTNNLIEQIPREYNSLRYVDGPPKNQKLMIERYGGTIKEDGSPFDKIYSIFFMDPEFVSIYLKTLDRMSSKYYLDDFFRSINEIMTIEEAKLFRNYPYYKFPKEYLYIRQNEIRTKLSEKLDIKVYLDREQEQTILTIINNSVYWIQPKKVESSNETFIEFSGLALAPGEQTTYIHHSGINDDQKFTMSLFYEIYKSSSVKREVRVVPKSLFKN